MSPTVRRQKLLESLCRRRHDTYANLAPEFGVSVMTIRRDVQALIEMHYPLIIVRGRYGGGVTVMDGYNPYHSTLSTEEIEFLRKYQNQATGSDLEMWNQIFAKLAS